MKQFVWKDSFAIGIHDIDQQHQVLLGHLNDCILSASTGGAAIDISALFTKLKAYARLHFTAEERLLVKIGYPDLDQHQQQHKLFEGHVNELEKSVIADEKKAIASLIPFLKDWYLQHILVEDRRYAEYMHAKGFGKDGFDFSIW